MTSILLVEDDEALAKLIATYLQKNGYEVIIVGRGDEARESVRMHQPELVILDLMLPGLDGMDVCRQLREDDAALPIIMLTARNTGIDEVLGLETGADDFVPKPCEPRLLLARIRTLLRRSKALDYSQDDHKIVIGKLIIELSEHRVTWLGNEMPLSSVEFKLLVVLAKSAGEVLSRDQLIQQMRGIEFNGLDRSVDVAISKLRRSFGDPSNEPRKIKTIWGKGYLLSRLEWDD